MRIPCKAGDLKQVIKDTKSKNEKLLEYTRWGSDDKEFDVFAGDLTPEELDALERILDKAGITKSVRKIKEFRKVIADPTNVKVSRLEALEIALKEFIAPTPNKWLFKQEADGSFVPYYVSNINFEPADERREKPAQVSLKMQAQVRGVEKNTSETWEHTDLAGAGSVRDILLSCGLFLETEALVQAYEKQMERYREVRALTGEQFAGTGVAYTNGRWHQEAVHLVREDQPAKLVIDDAVNEKDNGDTEPSNVEATRGANATLWVQWNAQKSAGGLGAKPKHFKKEELDLDDDEASVVVPVHPYVQAFDLAKHRHVIVHITNVEPWAFQEGLMDKLVLTEEVKDLVALLIDSADTLIEDIVKGKTGGIIVASTGLPGVGKTLTAEVFSEHTKRPLYSVACSQLGTDEEELEASLELTLSRSKRWKAILLLDEADVYVHERGDNIHQNAIVGVFLRVLEYYRGVMFLTSNRDVIIDDAILSRCTAHIRYDLPNEERLGQVWDVLSTQYGIKLDTGLRKELLAEFKPGTISPRNIKNLLKLARSMVLQRKHPINLALFKFVARFIDFVVKREIAIDK